jgi:hypothetical protein
MPTEELTLHSQATIANGGLFAVGTIFSGDPDASGAAAALRFALPSGFDNTQRVVGATLNLYASRSSASDEQRHQVGVLNSSSQVLPMTEAGVENAAIVSPVRMIGFGTFDPAINVEVPTSDSFIEIDLLLSFEAADNAGLLDGGFVVVLIQPLDFGSLVWISAAGLTQTNPPTIDFEYDADVFTVEATLSYTLDDVVLHAEVIEGPIGDLDVTLEDVTLEATGNVAERFALLAVTLDNVTLASTAEVTIAANVDVTLDSVALTSSAIMFAQADLAVTLDDVALDSFGTQVAAIAGDLDVSLDAVALASDVSVSGGGFLAVTLDDVVLASEVIGPRVGRVGLFADGGFLADSGFLL